MTSPTPVALSHRDWLHQLIVDRLPGEVPRARGSRLSRVRQARRHLAEQLVHLGILYGTPLLPAELDPGLLPSERLFLAIMSGLVRLGGDLAAVLGRDPRRRILDVAVPFMALAGLGDRAQKLIDRAPADTQVKSELRLAARQLALRAESLTSDPSSGVPIHNGITYADAWAFGRLAISYFSEDHLPPRLIERRLERARRDKADLVEALVQLVWADHAPSATERRAISRQISALGFSWRESRHMKEQLDRPTDPIQLAQKLRGREPKRFVMAQAILASLVDGRRSARELDFLRTLAKALGISSTEISGLELELAEFYAQNRDFVDTFTAARAGAELADELVDDLAHSLERNLAAVIQEVRQAGDLAELLAKAARGITLTAGEKKRMRAELVDVAKAIPSMALFAAPGGLLILGALAKVLPFSILPSSFSQQYPEPRQSSETKPAEKT